MATAPTRYEYDITTSASRGLVAISAMTIAPRNKTKYDRRQPTSIALMLRKRIVLTIRNAGTSTTASAGTAARGSWIPHGHTIVVRQVVGILARRIVCRVSEGDRLQRGERIGLMKFGSRMDVFLPTSAELRVRVGDRVVAGETVLAVLRSALVE